MSLKRSTFKSTHSNNYGIFCLDDMNEFVLGTSSGTLDFYDMKNNKKKRSCKVSSYFLWPIVRPKKPILITSGGGSTNNYNIYVVNITTNRKLFQLSGHKNQIYGLGSLSPEIFASCSWDKSVRIWNWKKKYCLRTLSYVDMMNAAVFNGKYFCTAGYNRCITSYTPNSNFTIVRKYKECYTTSNVWTMAALSQKERFAVGEKNSVEIFDIEKGTKLRKFTEHHNWVYGMDFVAPNVLVTVSYDRRLVVYDVIAFKTLHNEKFYKYLSSVSVSHKGDMYVSGYTNDIYKLASPYCKKEDAHFVMGQEGKETKQFTRRFDLITKHWDHTLVFREGKVKCFKSFLFKSRVSEALSKGNETMVDGIVTLDSNRLLKLFFGIKLDVSEKETLFAMFDYYNFFTSLKMKNRAFLICKLISKVRNIGALLFLFKRSIEVYQDDISEIGGGSENEEDKEAEEEEEEEAKLDDFLHLDDDAIAEEEEEEVKKKVDKKAPKYKMFKSAFSMACFNEFKNREVEIRERKKLRSVFIKEKLMRRINYHELIKVENHPEFKSLKGKVKMVPSSFLEAFKNDLKDLHPLTERGDEKSTPKNITLRSDDGAQTFEAHREFLILKSYFFEKLFSSEDKDIQESIKEGELTVPCNSNVLRELLNFIYLGYVKTNDMKTLFAVYTYAMRTGEVKLKGVLVNKIKSTSKSIIEKFDIYYFLRSNAEIVQNEELVKEFVNFWATEGKMNRKELYQTFDKSKSDNKVANLESNVKYLLALTEQMKDRIEVLELELQSLKEQK